MRAISYGDVIEFIKNEMVARRITQAQLAEKAGVTEWTLSRYMTGQRKMPFNTMVNCLEALGFSFEIAKQSDTI